MKILAGAGLVLTLWATPAWAQRLELASPDGANRVTLELNGAGTPVYTVARKGAAVLAPSPIAFELGEDRLGIGLAVTGSDKARGDTRATRSSRARRRRGATATTS